MVQQLESELQAKQLEANKMFVEKHSNMERIKVLEHELNKIKKMEAGSSEPSAYQRLQGEYEDLKVTNSVYLEKIEELVEQINQMKDQYEERISELEGSIESAHRHTKEHSVISEIGRPSTMSDMGKNSVSKANYGVSDDVNVLKKEIDTLKQRIVILTDKNMEYQNAFADFKSRDRSRSKNVKK